MDDYLFRASPSKQMLADFKWNRDENKSITMLLWAKIWTSGGRGGADMGEEEEGGGGKREISPCM